MYISIINGPNLNLSGRRQPEIYGTETLEETIGKTALIHPEIGQKHIQSNCEGAIIDALQEFGFDPECIGIIINPGAYAHYSYAIADAIKATETPVVEVHISNIHSREEFRQTSVTARSATAVIAGCGREGYALARHYLLRLAGIHSMTPHQ